MFAVGRRSRESLAFWMLVEEEVRRNGWKCREKKRKINDGEVLSGTDGAQSGRRCGGVFQL